MSDRQQPDWFPQWDGECVAVIGSGPSAKTDSVAKLRNRIHVLAVNEGHRLCPWADMLYGCEGPWWNLRQKETSTFKGIRVGYETPLLLAYPQTVHRIEIARKKNWRTERDWYVHEFLFDKPGRIGSGQNSGFQAVNLAAQFGATGIALIGFDMKMSPNIHWHGHHPSPLRNPDYDRFTIWRDNFTRNAPTLAARGIDVVNCCMDSGLEVFPRMSIEAMLERWSL